VGETDKLEDSEYVGEKGGAGLEGLEGLAEGAGKGGLAEGEGKDGATRFGDVGLAGHVGDKRTRWF
jgi:hypothetical protein